MVISSANEAAEVAADKVGASLTSLIEMSISEVVIFSPSLAEMVML